MIGIRLEVGNAMNLEMHQLLQDFKRFTANSFQNKSLQLIYSKNRT